jgi:transcriptional regulator with XRE-family HTH domain
MEIDVKAYENIVSKVRKEMQELIDQQKKLKDFAKEIGVTQLTLRSFLQDGAIPSHGTLVKVNNYLNKQ